MLTLVVKATSHFAVWIVWKTTRVSLLGDLEAPERSK
jgi:hypothetical protein